MNFALVKFLVVNRVIVLSIYLFVAWSFSAKMSIIRKKKQQQKTTTKKPLANAYGKKYS